MKGKDKHIVGAHISSSKVIGYAWGNNSEEKVQFEFDPQSNRSPGLFFDIKRGSNLIIVSHLSTYKVTELTHTS